MPDVSTSSLLSQLVSWPASKHPRVVPLHHSMLGEMAQRLDVQSSVHCTSQRTTLRRTVDHCPIRSSRAGPT